MAKTEKGLFSSRDGTAIYYEVRGEGRPLLFCNGLLCRREHWRHQVDYFADSYKVVTFDYRGHQRSSAPRNDRHLTLEWCARDVQDLMSYLGLEEAVILGHSMGVPVLTHAAALEPTRIRAGVMVCGSVNNPFEQMLFTDRLDGVFTATLRVYETAPTIAGNLWRSLTRFSPVGYFFISQLGFNPSTAPERDIRSYMDGVNETPMAVFQALLADYRRVDRRPLLHSMNVPVLVVAGEDDCITPMPIQEELARLLPQGELERIPQGTHNAHVDFPDTVNARIGEFLARIGYR